MQRFDGPRTARFHEVQEPVAVIVDAFMRGLGRVDRDRAISVPAVLRGRNMICAASTLPLQAVDSANRVLDHPLLRQINPDVPNVVTMAQTIEDLLFEAVAWWRITRFGSDGYPVEAVRYDPGTVSLNPPEGYEQGLLPSYLPTTGVVYMAGEAVPWAEVIRFDSPNPALLVAGQQAIKRSIALALAASMYATRPRRRGYFSPKEDADPFEGEDADVKVQQMLDDWARSSAANADGYVPAAVEYTSIQDMNPAELQLIEQQKNCTLEIANLLGIDPEDLGLSTTSRTYQNATDRRQDRINDVLSPYMTAITDRLSMPDVTKRGTTTRFQLDRYLRADPKTRAEVQQIYANMGVLSPQDVQEIEGIPRHAVQKPAPARPAVEPPVRVPSTTGRALEAASPAALTFAMTSTRMEFDGQMTALDGDRRTITGVAVPWNAIGMHNGRRYRFARGAITWSAVNRVKLLRDHNNASAMGRAVTLVETDRGLEASFKISNGRAGDEALALAADGVLDGLSIGVDFRPEDTVPDPHNRGVLLVTKAALREVSLTAVPAFDDSRLTSVRASYGGGNMPCPHCGADLTPGVAHTCTPAEPATATPPAPAAVAPAPATFTADQFAAMMGALAGRAPAEPAEARPTVNPTGTPAPAQVTEPAAYAFSRDGTMVRGTHEFSSDIGLYIKGDQGARQRVDDFIRARFAVVTTDINELNPTRNRPDMYVDQRAYRYPVWEAINKGTLADITPFTFPKFSSASGLVGAHTEGTEPSSGSFVTTSQTVTPSAMSGKVKISRETIDQGGNPQVSNLIWQKMERAWYEALEAAAVAVLDNASPTAIALTAGGGTTGQTAVSELVAAFAALQYVRGGFTMDNAFLQIDLYKLLAGAKDGQGRPLFPLLGPANANGTISPRASALDILGVTGYPAWALAATGSAVASSYLFDSQDVHGWASNPRRLDFDIEVANLYIGLWGYVATAISDINGVREITYDPVP